MYTLLVIPGRSHIIPHQNTTFTSFPPLTTTTRRLFRQSFLFVSQSWPSSVFKIWEIIQSCSASVTASCSAWILGSVSGANAGFSALDNRRGIVTVNRSLPLTWTAVVWQPRANSVLASESVSSGVGHGTEKMDGLPEIFWSSVLERISWCRTSHNSDARVGAMGERRRRRAETQE